MNNWKSYEIKSLPDDVLDELYSMFKASYKEMGNIMRTVVSPDKLKKHKYVLLLDYDNDNSYDAFIVYNNVLYGNKIAYLGSKNNIVAKSKLMETLKELLIKGGWFIEGGRKIETFCVKYNIPFINDTETIKKIIKNKNIELLSNGYYKRAAAFGSPVKKRLYGTF